MQRNELPPVEMIEPLVAAAHAIWCDRMKHAGWRFGEQYDADAKTDPCLKTFTELPAFERDHVVDGGIWREVIDAACENIDSSFRFASSELRATDLSVGTRVRLTPGNTPQPDEEVWDGRVVELKISGTNSGRLISIGVRWQDGCVQQHLANELEVVSAAD